MFHKKYTVYLFGAATFLFTVFIFLNTYEVLFNRDVAFAHSVEKMPVQQVINDVVSGFTASNQGTSVQTNGDSAAVESLTIREGATVNVENARNINGLWYERPSLAGLIDLDKDSAGHPVDYLVYTSASWRTIPRPDQLTVGTVVELEYQDGSVKNFQVSEKQLFANSQSFIVSKSDSQQVLLLVENQDQASYYGFSLTGASAND